MVVIERKQIPGLSALAQALVPSATMAAAAAANVHPDPINLGIGEPVEPPAEEVSAAAMRAARDGEARYGPADGLPELRELAAEDQTRRSGIARSLENVIITAGGKPALMDAMRCLVNPGDEVLVLAPFWPSFLQQVQLAGGVARIVQPGPDMLPDPAAIASACTERTRLVILNNPGNPTSQILGAERLRAIAEVVDEHDLWVLADEVYSGLVLDGDSRGLLNICPDLADRTVVVESFSKRFCMTGYRLGYACAPAAVIEAMTRLATASTTCVNILAQHAGMAALRMDGSWVEGQRRTYLRRRDETAARLLAMGCDLHKTPEAGFYHFFRAPGVEDDVTWARGLFEQEGVTLIPGTAFGVPSRMRLSYGATDARLEEAAVRIQHYLDCNS